MVEAAVRAAAAPRDVETAEDPDHPCYQWITFSEPCDPLLPSVGVTVIITMDPTRIRQALAHVLRVGPSRHYAVLNNRGFRRCRKPAFVVDTALDLYHANAVAMAYSRRNYPGKNLLLLEDDCTWDLPVALRVLPEAERFLARTPAAQHYFLGGLRIPMMTWPPVFGSHLRVRGIGGAHAVIHTPAGLRRRDMRGTAVPATKLVDALFAEHGVAYASREVAALQTWPVTQNSTVWDNAVIRKLLRTLRLDRRAQPGTDISNHLASYVTVYSILSGVAIVGMAIAIIGALKMSRP